MSDMATRYGRAISAANRAGAELSTVLAVRRHVVTALEPGDGTRYVIAITEDLDELSGAGWVVALPDFGRTNAWAGGPMHEDYATEKLGGDNPHTGRIVAAFLTGLSGR